MVPVKCIYALWWLRLLSVSGGGSVVVDFFIVTPIVRVCSMFCCTLLYFHFSFAIILMGERELVALPCLSSWRLVMVVWLFLAEQRVCLRFVIVVFPDHAHFLFFKIKLLFCLASSHANYYRLLADINECQSGTLNTCQQKCTNTEGGFSCSCNVGYVVNSTNPTLCNG